MQRIVSRVLGICLLLSSFAAAQVLLPEEVQAPGPHRLQQKYLGDLRAIGSELEAHKFPFHFYFSRALDISEKDQLKADQRSIRFERFHDYTVLAITGNYFAAYSGELANKNERAKKTLEDVVAPIIRAAVPHFVNDDTFDGYAIEVSQHVRRKVIGISSESAENLVYFFPRSAAQHLSVSRNEEGVQGALLESKVFIDAEPFNLWVNGERPGDQPETYANARPWSDTPSVAKNEAPTSPQTVSQKFTRPAIPVRFITPKVLSDLKAEYSTDVQRLEHDMGDEVHFAKYVPTQFVGFHEGAYLQLSVLYEMTMPAEASRYKVAALTFDEHVAHLIRATLTHFQDSTDFDGVVYSVIAKPASSDTSEAVEFFLPLQAMRCYARYDCTGQDLIDSGFVLINGERATLNLQMSENTPRSFAAR